MAFAGTSAGTYSTSLVKGVRIYDNSKNKARPGGDDPEKVAKSLHFDLHRPLEDALKSVFQHCGSVVLTFPSCSGAQVQKYAYHIEKEINRHVRPPSSTKERLQEGDSESDDNLPGIRVEIVETEVLSIPEYLKRIRKIMEDLNLDIVIDVVKLVAIASKDEELAIRNVNDSNTKAEVFFKSFEPNNDGLDDDTAVFFRLAFLCSLDNDIDHSTTTTTTTTTIITTTTTTTEEATTTTTTTNVNPLVLLRVILLINLNTLLPIGSIDNKLYTVLPEMTITPPIMQKSSKDLLPWIPKVVKNPEKYKQHCLYREHGTDIGTAIYRAHLNDPSTERISKGMHKHAILAASDMKFRVNRFNFATETWEIDI